MKKRPSVANTFVSEGRLIASYKQYANNTGTSDFAKALQGAINKPAAPTVVPIPSSISPAGHAAAAKASAVAEAANADASASVSRAAATNGTSSKLTHSMAQFRQLPSVVEEQLSLVCSGVHLLMHFC